jgi:hypothetical protein
LFAPTNHVTPSTARRNQMRDITVRSTAPPRARGSL